MRQEGWHSRLTGKQIILFSFVSSEETGDGGAEVREFVRKPPAQKKNMAIVIEPKSGRDAYCPSRWHVPCSDRREIVGGFMQAKAVAIAQAAVHFRSHNYV